MFLPYSFKFHIKLSQSHLVNNREQRRSGRQQLLSQRQLLTRGYCAEPCFSAATGTCRLLICGMRKPLLPCWTNKRKMFSRKDHVCIPHSAFPCGKRCLGGPGVSEPRQSRAHLHAHPRFLRGLCWAPWVQLEEPDTFSLQMLHPSAPQPPAAAGPACPWELAPHQKRGVSRGGRHTVSQLVQPPDRH